MKKIILSLAAVAMAASMFAVDISSTVKMDASIANKNGDDVEFFTVKGKEQKDSDALSFSASGEKAGASFQLWYKYDGTDTAKLSTLPKKGYDQDNDGEISEAEKEMIQPNVYESSATGLINVRNVSLWFKPISSLKITVGDVNVDSYKEQIFWWHGVYGALGDWNGVGGEYQKGVGVKTEFTPIENLDLTFAFMPGIDTAWLSTKDGSDAGKFALKAKYSNIAGLPLSATAVFAYDSKASKIIGIGADYSADGFYGFLNANIRLGEDDLAALAFDNFVKYSSGSLTVAGHFPLNLIKVGDEMKATMLATVKASYAINGFTPFLLITNEPDNPNTWWILDENFQFNLTINPGVEFSVGSCGFKVGARVDIADGELDNWSIPVELTVGL